MFFFTCAAQAKLISGLSRPGSLRVMIPYWHSATLTDTKANPFQMHSQGAGGCEVDSREWDLKDTFQCDRINVRVVLLAIRIIVYISNAFRSELKMHEMRKVWLRITPNIFLGLCID